MWHEPHAVFLVDYENSAQKFVSTAMTKKPEDIEVYVFYNPATPANHKVDELPRWVNKIEAKGRGKNASDFELIDFAGKYLKNCSPVHLCIVYKNDRGYEKHIKKWQEEYPRVEVQHMDAQMQLTDLYGSRSKRCTLCTEKEDSGSWMLWGAAAAAVAGVGLLAYAALQGDDGSDGEDGEDKKNGN